MTHGVPLVELTASRKTHSPLLWVRCARVLGAPQYRTCRRIVAEGDIEHGEFDEAYPDHASLFEGLADWPDWKLQAMIGRITIEPTRAESRPHIEKREYMVNSQYGGWRLQVTCKCGAAHKLYTEKVAEAFSLKLTAGADLLRPVSILTSEV